MAIQAQPPSTATARFPATRRAGAATNLALRIRRHGRLPISQIERFAQPAAIDVMDLKLSLLPLLSDCDVVDLSSSRVGTITEVEELVGVGAPVLEQCSAMWEASTPSLAESAAIDVSDQCSYVPETATSVHDQLEALGVPEAEHGEILAALVAVGLIRRQHSPALGELILYSPYVWGSEAVNIAEFMAGCRRTSGQACSASHE